MYSSGAYFSVCLFYFLCCFSIEKIDHKILDGKDE